MKLHLNLTLRRALMAAMAMVTLHTAEAALTTKFNKTDAYVTGEGVLTEKDWNDIWNKHKSGTLTIGSYEGSASVDLTDSTYNSKNGIIFVGGTGHNSNGGTANDGTLNVTSSVNVDKLHVGLSQKQCNGTLDIDGGKVTAASELTVGGYAGTGIIDAVESTITVGTDKKTAAVFRVGYHNGAGQVAGSVDAVSLTNSSITVGAAGGAKDLTSIGHEAGVSDLNLDNSTATFYDQTIVGEIGAQGTIHVHNGSTLTMEDVVLGLTSGAKGTICVEDSDVEAENLVVGEAGQGVIELAGESSLTADYITLGDENGGSGTINAAGGTIETGLLTIGDAGKGSVISAADITADDIVIGNQVTGTGSLVTEGSVTADKLYVGYKGTGTASVNGGTLDAKEAYITGTSSVLTAANGTTTLGKATVLGGKLTTSSTGTTKVTGELILDEAGQLVNAGTTDVASAMVAEGAGITATGGTLTIDTLVNSGKVDVKTGAELEAGSLTNNATITNAGVLVAESMSNLGTVTNSNSLFITELENAGTITNTNTLDTVSAINKGTITNAGGTIWNIGDLTSTEGSIANNGTITSTGKVVTGAVTTDGSGYWTNNGSWTITGQTEVTVITNNKDITITGAGRVEGNSLTGEGTTTIAVDKTTVNGTVVNLELTPENKDAVKVTLDMSNTADLVGKDLTFLTSGTLDATADDANDISLVNADQKSTGINWTESYIDINGTSNKLWFTSDYADNAVSQMKFTKMAEYLRTETDVKTEESETSVTLEYEKQTLVTEEKTVDTSTIEKDSALADAILGKDTSSSAPAPTLQTVVVETEKDNTVGSGSKEEANPVNIIVGSGLTESTGLVVETVVVKQVTKDEGAGAVVSSKTAGTSGLALVFSGESKQAGVAENKDTNHLGFADNLKGEILKTDDGMDKKVQTIDLVEVKADSNVTLGNLNMHSTHNFVVKEGATLTFDGVNLKVGGSHDDDIEFQDVQVEVEKEDADGNKTIEIETVRVENKESAHMETGSMIGEANADAATAATTTVHITNGSKVEFEKVYASNGKEEDELGTTTIAGANTLVQMSGEGTTLGMDKVLKDDAGKPVLDDRGHEKHGQQIVFDHGAHLKGTGHLKNIHMKEGTTFTVGNSPGKFTASELTVDGKTNFYLIVDSNDWEDYKKTGDAKDLTAEERKDGAADGEWGAISQLVVAGPVTLNGDVVFSYQEFDEASGKFVDVDREAARKELGKYFTDDSTITFVDIQDGGELVQGENFRVLTETLPELPDGMEWDASALFTDHVVRVISEYLEEPTRVANSLVSAGETVLSFGRLAQSQAFLREAGTTRTWASALGMSNSIDSGSVTNGYDYSNWGAAVGVDHAFTKNTVIGVAFGCSWGENEAEEGNGYYDGGSIDQDAKMIGIYGVHKFKTKGLLNDVKLNAFAAYGMFENDSTRTNIKKGHTADAEWDSDAWVISASLSRDITTDCGVVFTPYVGVEYTTAGMDDFSETGKFYTADYTADEDYSNLSVKVGVTVSKDFDGFTPYASIAYINDVDRSAAEVTAEGKRTATGKSALPGRDAFQIGAGFNWQLTETLDLNAGYSAEFRSKATEQSANVGIGLTF
ncbi:MAG: autotransporter domain-containing protein [Akkermansiaceae bacterium]|nr:autotransporter domain-containing protein [Akkermansiaceae bacterium]